MTTLLQAIGDILRPHLVGRGSIVLEERQPNTCRPITLHKSGHALVLQPDLAAGGICPRPDCVRSLSAPDRLFPLFRVDVPDLAVMCDYIIFCQQMSGDHDELFVLHCELKSNNIGGSRQQIENGKLLVDYILAMAKHHRSIRTMPIVKQRGLVFSPKFDAPKGSLIKFRCQYERLPNGFDDLPFAYYGAGKEYPLMHFCA